MELIGTRMRDGFQAAQLYAQAVELPPRESLPKLEQIEPLVRANRDAHEALGREFERLWRADCKPYALDGTMARYAATVKWYDGVLEQLATARQAAQAGEPLPPPETVGIALPDKFTRRTRPHRIEATPLDADAPWADAEATVPIGVGRQGRGRRGPSCRSSWTLRCRRKSPLGPRGHSGLLEPARRTKSWSKPIRPTYRARCGSRW